MGLVYLLTINTGPEELYKIGITQGDVRRRVKQLSTGSAYKIDVLKTYESVNYRRVEKWLHSTFNTQHTESGNEWFHLSNQQVLDFISYCEKGDKIISFMLKENPFFK